MPRGVRFRAPPPVARLFLQNASKDPKKQYVRVSTKDSVRHCVAELGYTVIDQKVASKAMSDAYAELEVIACVCTKDKTKLFVFSEKDDIAKIQQ